MGRRGEPSLRSFLVSVASLRQKRAASSLEILLSVVGWIEREKDGREGGEGAW